MSKLLVFVVGLLAAAVVPTVQADDLAIADGLRVSMEYTLTLPDKSIVGSNVGKEPIAFVEGSSQIVPGLEKALLGMKAGQQKHVELSAADGYGAYDEKARVTVDKKQVPENVKTDNILRTPEGRLVKVLDVSEDKVVLDLNHPLAGKDLVFDVKIVKVEKPEPAPVEAE